MAKVKFNVSARTARLIGRENVSSPNGALIELIKNCHDADSGTVAIIFDIKYSSTPTELSRAEIDKISKKHKTIKSFYEQKGELFSLKSEFAAEIELIKIFRSHNKIYIFDNGHGMTEDIIENHWMTIGTDNKLNDPYSPDGRVKSGAKGIGRFALDRLGSKGELITYSKKHSKTGLHWKVDWEDFEIATKKLSDITADLDLIENTKYETILIDEVFSKFNNLKIKSDIFERGSFLKISDLRDWWSPEDVKSAYDSLESLIPPSFQKKFKVFVHDERIAPDKVGLIVNQEQTDFDYKIEANFKNVNDIKVKIYRNEFDLEKMPKAFFSHPDLKEGNFKREDFKKDFFEETYTIKELMGTSEIDEKIFNTIGAFEFSFIFMKKSCTTQQKEIFAYKDFEVSVRAQKLSLFGGVKLYRDNFRVRPYGEISGTSFDWLKFGERAAISPAAPTHLSGGWRIRPYQAIGSVIISRISNINFEDKSSREGIQENESFKAFQNLLIAIVNLFEKDRQSIMRVLKKIHDNSDQATQKIKRGDALIKQLKTRMKAESKDKKQETATIIDAYEAQQGQIKTLMDENKLLVGLASTGLTISVFSHELNNIQTNLVSTTNNLEKNIHKFIDVEKVNSIKSYQDPRVLIKDLIGMNKRINNWLLFTLECVKKDKRTRKKINFVSYFEELKSMWSESLLRLETELIIPDSPKSLYKQMFQIDLDSIFNNLIINSIYAFENRKDSGVDRKISISIAEQKNEGIIRIRYKDTGPGLDPALKNKRQIFEALFTTKKSKTGDKIGTGMGMWILEKTVKEYQGIVEVGDSQRGFSLEIKIPIDAR